MLVVWTCPKLTPLSFYTLILTIALPCDLTLSSIYIRGMFLSYLSSQIKEMNLFILHCHLRLSSTRTTVFKLLSSVFCVLPNGGKHVTIKVFLQFFWSPYLEYFTSPALVVLELARNTKYTLRLWKESCHDVSSMNE